MSSNDFYFFTGLISIMIKSQKKTQMYYNAQSESEKHDQVSEKSRKTSRSLSRACSDTSDLYSSRYSLIEYAEEWDFYEDDAFSIPTNSPIKNCNKNVGRRSSTTLRRVSQSADLSDTFYSCTSRTLDRRRSSCFDDVFQEDTEYDEEPSLIERCTSICQTNIVESIKKNLFNICSNPSAENSCECNDQNDTRNVGQNSAVCDIDGRKSNLKDMRRELTDSGVVVQPEGLSRHNSVESFNSESEVFHDEQAPYISDDMDETTVLQEMHLRGMEDTLFPCVYLHLMGKSNL